ncbi:MAG TPA: nucleoside triphosphate pyrophosphohydrolase family protein [Candidatus Saccharimonadales bacterium]|jgi:NTP pyrophosphatase (non-canonical NTP hydrolase)|nr:nucleoside triphosphate pyrophosphohydrolase family protein [Candidatus Saccharimonadales bacterium]
MTFDDYQQKAITTDVYGGKGDVVSIAFINKVLGLVGESGEVADKVKKLQRNNDGKMSNDERRELLKEVGDVLWYLSAITHYLGGSLNEVAEMNLEKLFDRKARGVIKSQGDNR